MGINNGEIAIINSNKVNFWKQLEGGKNLMNNVAKTEQTADSEFFQMLTAATLVQDSTTLKSVTKED